MTIITETDAMNEIFERLKDKFVTGSPGFHNLLWSLVVKRFHEEQMVCLYAVHSGSDLQLSYLKFNESGHYPTHVQFAPEVDYNEAVEIAFDLNENLFGFTKELSMVYEMVSLRKDVDEDEDENEDEDED